MEQARQQLEQWRSTHRPRSRIPDTLWTTAAEVARQYGLYRTAHTLRLDYMRLKQRVQPGSCDSKTAVELPAFLELMPPTGSPIPECVVELEGARGRMRIHMKGTATAELMGLSRMLWVDKG